MLEEEPHNSALFDQGPLLTDLFNQVYTILRGVLAVSRDNLVESIGERFDTTQLHDCFAVKDTLVLRVRACNCLSNMIQELKWDQLGDIGGMFNFLADVYANWNSEAEKLIWTPSSSVADAFEASLCVCRLMC